MRLGGPQLGQLLGPLALRRQAPLCQSAAFNSATSPFVGASDGWYWDLTDVGVLFTTSGGSTNVAAASDPIGRVNDKSPFGHNTIQATSGARPTWQTSGGYAGGEFDGTDDFLSAGDVCDLRTKSFWGVVAVKYNSSANGCVFAKSLSAGNAGRYALFRSTTITSGYDQNGSTLLTSGATDSSTAMRILTMRLDRTAGSLKLHANRVQLGTTTSVTPDTASDRNIPTRLLLGAYNNTSDKGITLPLNGRIVRSLGVITSTIDETLIAKVEADFANVVGVSLP